MTLNRATIDAVLADIAAAKTGAQTHPPHVIGHNEATEDADIAATIAQRGGAVLDIESIPGIGAIMGGEVRRIHYRSPDGAERWAYAIPYRFEIDAFGEESLICSSPAYDNPADLAEAIRLARSARRDESAAWLDRLDAADAKWSAIWPSDLGYAPRALPWLLTDSTMINYARQVRDLGPTSILTWPDKTLFETRAKLNMQSAMTKSIPIADSPPARMMAALIQLYSAAGLLS